MDSPNQGWLKVANAKRKNLLGYKPSDKNKQTLNAQDLQDAEEAIIRLCQETSFADEMCSLRRGKAVKTSSHLVKLSPFLQNGRIRVGGRLNKSAMPFETKHPIILPNYHHVTRLIIRYIHEIIGHSGRNHTLASLRQRF